MGSTNSKNQLLGTGPQSLSFMKAARALAPALQKLPEQVVVPCAATEEMVAAVRSILLYAETPGRTLSGLRAHLGRCGSDIAILPKWAQDYEGHVTKSGLASIIWHVMLEAAPKD